MISVAVFVDHLRNFCPVGGADGKLRKMGDSFSHSNVTFYADDSRREFESSKTMALTEGARII